MWNGCGNMPRISRRTDTGLRHTNHSASRRVLIHIARTRMDELFQDIGLSRGSEGRTPIGALRCPLDGDPHRLQRLLDPAIVAAAIRVGGAHRTVSRRRCRRSSVTRGDESGINILVHSPGGAWSRTLPGERSRGPSFRNHDTSRPSSKRRLSIPVGKRLHGFRRA